MPTISVRRATVDDAPQLASLLVGLGHTTSSERIVAMWPAWAGAGNCAYVAVSSRGELVAVVTLHHMDVLHRPQPVGRITALYVDEAWRQQGIGRRLVQVAEEDCRGKGCGLLEITSNFRLPAAHRFYEHLGYEQTSVRLAKNLDRRP